MPKPLRFLIIALFTLFLLSGAMVIYLGQRSEPETGASTPDAAGAPGRDLSNLSIPPFALIDHDGKPFTRENLLGHVTILDVLFTNCPMACPLMTEKMHAMTEALADVPDIRFVSISIDPQRDTPARLREYRELHDISTDRWSMLTDPAGDDKTARAIVIDGLKGALDDDPSIPITASDGSKMNNIRHPTWFFLLGPDAKVIDIYASSADPEMQRLERDARNAAAK